MRIWLVQTGEELPLDGPNTRLLRTALLAEELAQRGHDVTYINATFNHQRKIQRAQTTQFLQRDGAAGRHYDCVLLAGRAYAANVSISRFRSHRENAAAFLAVAGTLPQPDVMLCGFPPIELADAAIGYAAQHGIPCAVDCRDMWPEVIAERLPAIARPFARFALAPLFRQKHRALARASALTGITDAFVKWGQNGAKRPAQPLDRAFHLTVSPTQIDAQAMAQSDALWDDMVGNNDQDRPIIGCFAGTFATRTDILTVIDGANALSPEERARIRIILCGKGDLADEMARRAQGNPAVVIAGWRNAADIAALMARSDFGILPYPNTPDFLASYPNKVGEYLLAGLPILTGLQGVTGPLLDAHGLGLRYTPGDVASVAGQLRSLLAAPASATLRDHARAIGRQHFDPTRIYPAFADWLESLASCAKLPAPTSFESTAA
ncbi:MAG: glycosyltransferase [Sphingopyxis sp.]